MFSEGAGGWAGREEGCLLGEGNAGGRDADGVMVDFGSHGMEGVRGGNWLRVGRRERIEWRASRRNDKLGINAGFDAAPNACAWR